ncbi:MAG: hypothetical protein HY673_18295 [Chloroflexi bacterium]|nr:hypothetical protein [Chloroflexota bacterium]
MTEWRAVLLIIHLAATLAMAAPLYMLIVVNERVRFGAPLGYYTDRYMENIIRNNAIRCFVFQATILVTGLALVAVTGRWASLLTDPAMVVKWVALGALATLLSLVHFSIQPRIEALVNQVKPNEPPPPDIGPKLAVLRVRRKKLSATCLFLVLTSVIMGLRVMFQYNFYLALLFVVLSAVYAWRAYRKPLPFGWI